MEKVRFITPAGIGKIRAEYDQLFGKERPKLVETISWAAANGDRSENGDYIYGRKKLREIDRRLSYLAKVMKAAKIVDPASQASRGEVRFGATVELADEDNRRRILTIVGDDESDATAGHIGRSAHRPGFARRQGRRRADRPPAFGREKLRDRGDQLSRFVIA